MDCITELQEFDKKIENLAVLIIQTIERGGKILLAGNGGSAADAQHFSAELVGRFRKERRGLPVISLTTDTSTLTSVSNDFGYEHVFSRQVEALGHHDDLLVLISTSGNSQNLLNASKEASIMGLKTAALLGDDGGQLKNDVDLSIIVPSNSTARVQEMHILIGHILCDLIEKNVNIKN